MYRYFLLIFLFLGILFQGMFKADVIKVPVDYNSIQEAIIAAQNGDTVLVANGIYFENINFNSKNILVASYFITDNDFSRLVLYIFLKNLSK